MMLKKIIATVLSGAFLSGCATQKVSFTSFPMGVDVIAGEKRGTTPCTLRIREDLEYVIFALPSGEIQTLPLPKLDSDVKEVSEELGRAAGGILMVAGGVVGFAGLGLFLLGSSDLDDEESETDSDDYSVMGVGVVGMALGVGVFFLGKAIYPDDASPVLHAEFILFEDDKSAEGKKPVEGDDRYEDVGYGARRLKRAAP